MSLPDSLMDQFDQGARGVADIDMNSVLHGIIADVVDSARIAMIAAGVSEAQVAEVVSTVNGYVINHYGDK